MTRPQRFILATSFAAFAGSPAFAAVDFVKDVQPILEQNCVRCHNPKGTDFEQGDTDVDLSSKQAAFEVASTIVVGKPERSKLYTTTVLSDDAKRLMPPKNKVTGEMDRLSKEQSEVLKNWIAEGANWPEGITLTAKKKIAEAAAGKENALVAKIHEKIVQTSKEAAVLDMKNYSAEIPGADVKFDMVAIPGGKYKMGSSDTEKGHKEDEAPVHEVEISPFWMGKAEVTWNEFELFMYPAEEKKTREAKKLDPELNALTDASARPTQPYVEMSFGMGKAGFPAISMTQHAANKYCQWLSAKTGHFYRLPTEAEWEYAARAGTTTAYPWGDDASRVGEYAWYGENADFKYQKVAKKKPNAWGLYDMIGNVWEWCLDQYDPHYYANSPAKDPWNKATKPYPHVARGGGWEDEDVARLRVAARKASGPEWKVQDPQLPKSIWYHTDAQWLGFRVVRPLVVPGAEEMDKCWNSGVEKDDPNLTKAE